MSCFLRLVPWYNKAEWEKVFNGVYSDNIDEQEEAFEKIMLWQRKNEWCPHGVESTGILLQVILRDPEITPQTKQPLELEDLKLMYATAVMRVVNLVTETVPKSNIETMIQMAAKYNIPTWIINIRHEVAHGTIVPDIGILRMAASHLKHWLKGYYWEVEERSSKDFLIERPKGLVITERLTELLKIYINLQKLQVMKKYEKVKDIPDDEMRSKICEVSKLRTNLILAEYLPWDHKLDESQEIPPEKIRKYKLTKVIKLIMSLCKEYLKTDFCNFNTCQLLVDIMVKETGNESRKYIWGPLILDLNAWGRLMPLLNCLAKTCCTRKEYSHFCGLWVLELSKALLKRKKFEELKSFLSSLNIGKAYAKANISSLEEKKLLKRLVLERRLNVEREGRTVFDALMKRVEKKYSFFRTTLRLLDPVRIDNSEIKDLIRIVGLEPNAYSVMCIPVLLELLNPPMARRDKKNLLYLINIYMGNANTTTNYSFQMKDVSSLIQTKEKEVEERSDKLRFSPSEKELGAYKVTLLSGYDWSSVPFGVIPWKKND